jgi:enoyl-CoA hydratase/carnithine racemase
MNDILLAAEGGVLSLTLDRPQRKNALTAAMYTRLAEALSSAAQDAAVRVVLIQGHEAIFSAGNDMGGFTDSPSPAGEDSPVLRFLRAIADFPKPLVAAVCGPAVGIGTTLLFHCDLVYAGDNAMFLLPFVDLGLCPEAASSLLAPQLLGYHRAAEALLLGEPFAAQVALGRGLVNRVLPAREVSAYAHEQARKLAAKPLTSLVETKRLMKLPQQQAVLAQMRAESVAFARMLREPAAREALAAFSEKRKPDFSRF